MKEKILIALSDPTLASLIVQKLAKEGYGTSAVKSGEEALEKMQSEQPDLLLIDFVLPGKNGYEVLTEKSFDKLITKIPVIIVSNSGSPVDMNLLPSTPTIKDYVIKSHVDPDEVLEKIGILFNHPYQSERNVHNLKMNGKKILWVEDDKFLSMILLKKFEISGYTVLKAINGEEAITILQTEVPDIIVLDILLPGMNGFEVLQKIKMNEKLRAIPVIMLSNMSKASDIEKAKVLGAQKFLVKVAVSLDEIVKEISRLL